MDDLTQSLTSVWTNPAAGWSLMKAKLWEVQTEMQRRSGARSLELHQKCRRCLRHVRTTRAPPTAQRRHCGARGGEEVAATSDSLIAHHSYSLLLLNSISRRPARSNRCLRGGRKQLHSLQQQQHLRLVEAAPLRCARRSRLLLLAPLGRWLGAPEHSEGRRP